MGSGASALSRANNIPAEEEQPEQMVKTVVVQSRVEIPTPPTTGIVRPQTERFTGTLHSGVLLHVQTNSEGNWTVRVDKVAQKHGAEGVIYYGSVQNPEAVAGKELVIKEYHPRFAQSASMSYSWVTNVVGDHPNIVKYLAYHMHETKKPLLVMEKLNGTDLEEALFTKKFTLREVRRIWQGIISAFSKLQECTGSSGRTGFVILDVKEENMFLDQVTSGAVRQMRIVLIDLNLRPSHMDDSQAIWFNVRRSLFKIFQHVAGLEDTDDIQAFPFAVSTAKKMAELGMDELHTQPGMLKWMEHCNWGVFGNVEDKVRRAAADVLRGLASRDACDTELGHIGFLPFLIDDEIHSKHWDTIPEYFSRLPNYRELE